MKNKKLISFITASIVAGTGLAVGLPFAFRDKEESSIILRSGGQELVLDENVISTMETIANIQNPSSRNDGETPTEPPTETPTEPPTETPVEGTPGDRDSIKRIVADWIQVGFFLTSLTGHNLKVGETIESIVVDTQKESILNKAEAAWGHVGRTTNNVDFQAFYKYFVEAKIFNETTLAGKPLYSWLSEKSIQDFEIAKVASKYIDITVKSIWDAREFGANGMADYNELISVLGNTLEFQKDIANVFYLYSYLWQSSNSNGVYDYNITERLVENKAAFTWTFDITGIGTEIDDDLWYGDTTDYLVNNWNDLIDGSTTLYGSKTSGEKDKKSMDIGVDEGFGGFEGIQLETTSTVTEKHLWSYDEYFEYNERINPEDITQDWTSRKKGIGKKILVDEENERVIHGTDGTGKVIMYEEILPYVFSTNYDGNSADMFKYSIFTDNTNVNEMKIGTRDAGNTSIFEEYGINTVNTSTVLEENRNSFEAWLMLAMINSDREGIQADAFAYWKSHGFSIELTGSYEDDYAELIHKGIQR